MKAAIPASALLALVLSPATVRSEPVDWSSAETVAPGILTAGYRTERPRLLECRLLRVDLRQRGLSFVSTDRAENWGAPMSDVTNRALIVDTRRETTEAFARRMRDGGLNVVAAFNTSPWEPFEPPWNHRFASLPRLAVVNGRAVSHVRKPGAMLVVWKDNTVSITNDLSEADFPRVQAAHPGFEIILRGGKTVDHPSGRYLAPRTALGLSSDRRYLYALVVDGRQPSWSRGVETGELAVLLGDAGAADGINMDGGGSSTLVALDADGKTFRHLNRHDSDFSRYRAVSMNLGVVVRGD